MSDFVTELRREVVGAHAAHRHSAARTHRRRRRPVLAGAVALAVALAAIVVAYRSLPGSEQPAEPHVATVLHIGGNPADGVIAAGSLWVTDFAGRQVVRIDPERRKVIARIPLGQAIEDIAAGDGSVWARGLVGDDLTRIWRIDPATNRVAAQFHARYGDGLAVASGSVWAPRRDHSGNSLLQLSSATGRRVRDISRAGGHGIAVAGHDVWTITGEGTVARVDARNGRVQHLWHGLVPGLAGDGDNTEAITADHGGAWVIGTAQSAIFRVEAGRAVWTLDIPADSQPLLAHTRAALWVASQNDQRGHFRLSRIDPDAA